MNRKTYFLLIVIGLSSLLSFWKLGTHSLSEWDESRYGMIAFDMLKRNDFLHYYFLDNIDFTVNKPPLAFWAIAASYKVFGNNEFALRFPSAVSAVIIFITLFLWICLYQSEMIALLSCLVLMGVKGIIGWHVGRTGDTDALLICFQMLSLYSFSLFVDFEKKPAALTTAVFTGVAFMVKGIAGMFFLPAFIIYIVFRKKISYALKSKYVWVGIASFLVIVSTWLFMLKENTGFIERLYSVDVLGRVLENKNTNLNYNHSAWFVFKGLDSGFNLWNYLFSLSVIIFFVQLKRNVVQSNSSFYHLSVLSFAIIVSISLLLTFTQSQMRWYVSEIIPFCAAFTVLQLMQFRTIYVSVVIYALIIFTVFRNFFLLNTLEADRGQLLRSHRLSIEKARNVYWYNACNEQDFFLYLSWYRPQLSWTDSSYVLKGVDFSNYDMVLGKENDFMKKYIKTHPELNFQQSGEYFILSKR